MSLSDSDLSISLANVRVSTGTREPLVHGALSLSVGGDPVPSLPPFEGSIDEWVSAIRAALAALRDESGHAYLDLTDGTGRVLRLRREGDVVLAHVAASRFARPADSDPRLVRFRFASMGAAMSTLRDELAAALVALVPDDAARLVERVFGTEPPRAETSACAAKAPVHAHTTASGPAAAAPPRSNNWKIAAIVVSVLLGSCCLLTVGAGLVGMKVAERFALGYTPAGLVETTRDGVRVLEHPHLGFALRHPGDDFVRTPSIEQDSLEAASGSHPTRDAEFVAYADTDERYVVLVAIEPIPLDVPRSFELSAQNVTREYRSGGYEVVSEAMREAGGRRWFEATFVQNDVYQTVALHHVRSPEDRPYLVLLSVSGPYPEAYLPVLDSFAERGAPLGHARTLDAERASNETVIDRFPPSRLDVPSAPPSSVPMELVRYPSSAGELHAYLSRDPGDGGRHPALLWAHGGFEGIDEDCWEGPGRTYLAAGFVVMCPSWRGESGNPGRFELFHGELDDARAALRHLRALPYVEPDRVYVVGHSTGGTIALLLAESTDGIRAAVSIGGAPDVNAWAQPDPEDPTFPPYDPARHQEGYVRSALSFVGDLRAPVFYVEGADGVANPDMLDAMVRASSFTRFALRFVLVPDHDHFGVRDPAIAAFLPVLLADARSGTGLAITEDELLAAFANGPERSAVPSGSRAR